MPTASADRPAAFVLGMSETGLAAVRSLGRAGIRVVGVDSDPAEPGSVSRYCEPLLVDGPSGGGADIAGRLVQEARRYPGTPALLASGDAWVLFMSRNRETLARGFRFVLPEADVIEATVDKQRTYELAEGLGLPVPETWDPEVVPSVSLLADQLPYPVLLKPRVGHLWRQRLPAWNKGVKVLAPSELLHALQAAQAEGVGAVIQSIVTGPVTNLYEYCACVGRSGELLGEFVQRKIHQYPPEFGVGSLAESVVDPQVMELGRRVALGTGYRGVCSIEIKRDDRDGRLKLIEINPRLDSKTTLAARCGLDFPLIAYRDIIGENQTVPDSYATGAKWLDPPLDLLSLAETRRTQRAPMATWLATWSGVSAFPALASDDMRPFLFKYSKLARRAAARLFGSKTKQVGSP